ncbi:hypothetical protein GOBAR_AA03038 [Gossypium barbadense]|uniref:Uncharacterized protein n=1 Tax=Gossypium barbadense TaxID=3634 RepID=A0A2P5YPJ9_GOSBA|nr:hypothetical protein GOBAR_AA03038 [Gossypium barbadense]
MENSINLDGISSLSEIEDGGGLRADVDLNIKKVRFKGDLALRSHRMPNCWGLVLEIRIRKGWSFLGPWLIYGQYLTVQPWTKEFTPSQPYPSMVLAWIRLPGLPGFLYKKRILEEIGGIIGKVVLLDFNTDSRTKGRFAWIAVYINLDNPLIAQVLVNGLHQKVEYEALPMIYFTCGKYDHTKELCVPLQPETSSGKEQTGVTPVKDMNEGEGAIYGPWMVVEKKSRKGGRWGELKGISGLGFLKKDRAVGPSSAAIVKANGVIGLAGSKMNMDISCGGLSQPNGVLDLPCTKSSSQIEGTRECSNSISNFSNSTSMNISCFNPVFAGQEDSEGDVFNLHTKADSKVPELIKIQRHTTVSFNEKGPVGGIN